MLRRSVDAQNFEKKKYGLEFYRRNRPKGIRPPPRKKDLSPNEPRNFLVNVNCIVFYCNEKQMPFRHTDGTVVLLFDQPS